MEKEKALEYIKIMLNRSEDEAIEMLNGPGGKYFLKKLEHYEEMLKKISKNLDPLEATKIINSNNNDELTNLIKGSFKNL